MTNSSLDITNNLTVIVKYILNNIFGYTCSADYKDRMTIKSYFGRRMPVLGFMVGM